MAAAAKLELLKTCPAMPGFEHVNRFFDTTRKKLAAKILPGEYYVSKHDEYIMTTLGSCVSACIWDEFAKIGGMNHFMLPSNGSAGVPADIAHASEEARYGTVAMEHLINTILKNGGRRDRLRVKIVGGGRVLRTATDVGSKNINFVREFLCNENLAIEGEHLGGQWPRKVCFHPLTGSAQVKELKSLANDTVARRESDYEKKLRAEESAGSVELF